MPLLTNKDRRAVTPLRRLAGWLAAGLLAWAQPAPAGAPPLAFAVIDVFPYGYTGAATLPQGIYPRVLAALAQESEVGIQPSLMPFARAALSLANGDVSGAIMFRSRLTDGVAVPLMPLFVTAQVVQAAPGIALQSKSDLAPLLVGRIRGGCQDLEADPTARWRFYELNSHQQGIEMLLAHRIDAFCSATEALEASIAQYDVRRVLAPSARHVVSNKEVWVLLNNRVDEATRQRLRAAIVRLQRNGTLARIFQEELGPGYTLQLPAAAGRAGRP